MIATAVVMFSYFSRLCSVLALPRMYPRMGCVMPAASEVTSPVIVLIT